MNAESQPRYLEPNRSTRIFNATVARLTRMGISVYGSRVLAVRGRKSGEWRTTPVNPLTIDGRAVSGLPARQHPVGPQHARGRWR